MGDCRLKVRGPCTRRIEHLSSHLYKIAVKRVDVPCTHAFNADTDNLEDEQPSLPYRYPIHVVIMISKISATIKMEKQGPIRIIHVRVSQQGEKFRCGDLKTALFYT